MRLALFHTRVQVIQRSAGRSAVAAAAYRSTSALTDERTGTVHDYSNKPDLLHSAILLPAGAPDSFADRSTLWNTVEAAEKRKDAQLARGVEFALPHELSDAANIELARAFVQAAFVDAGMVADLNLHKPVGANGQAKPHAHVLLTLRAVDQDGFGPKVRAWNDRELVERWRDLLADLTNRALLHEGVAARVDPRSYQERGIELVPQTKIGSGARKREARGQASERTAEQARTAESNGKLLAAKPWHGLDFLTEHQSTFTKHDVARFAHRNSHGAEQFALVMTRLMAHPDLVELGSGARGETRYSTRRMVATERALAEDAAALAGAKRHAAAVADGEAGLGPDQRAALAHLLAAGDLKLVSGYAGTGKSFLLGKAKARWEAAGYRVRGAALSGIAAENLEHGSGIASRTLASLEYGWREGHGRLTSRDVLVVDEAGMVGSRQLARVLAAAAAAGTKVVLVGDPEQLQAIEGGAAFRLLAERHGAVALTEVRRQAGRHAGWMREATKELASGRTAAALDRYEAAGMVHAAATREDAMVDLVERWDRDHLHAPTRGQLILAYTCADVAALNDLARQAMRRAGSLEGSDVAIRTERGTRQVAVGDRLLFLKNERGLGVKNGTLGTLRGINGHQLAVQLDEGGQPGAGRTVTVDLGSYANLEHGYASTVHKSQGATVGRSHVLASRAFDRHATYVAATRHRGRLDLHFGRDEFQDRGELMAAMARERGKDTTLDYLESSRDRAAVRAVARQQVRQQAPQRDAGLVGVVIAKMRQRQQERGRGR